MLIVLAAVAVVGLFVVLRPKGTTAHAATATTIRIAVRDGKVVGGIAYVSLARRERVTLVVRTDVADQVHVHGYDLRRDVGPGAPARMAFDATLPGRFVVELEARRFLIAELQVSP